MCRRSEEVWLDLQDSQLLGHIDRVVFAHPSKPQGEGMALAIKHQIGAAPFFIVEEDHSVPKVYTDYDDFLREVLQIDRDS